MKTTSIYALVNPRNNEVRYVGKTVNVQRRKITHKHDLRNHNTHKVRWMKSILPSEPELVVLEEIQAGENWIEAEMFWIAYLKSLGANLTNSTAGGEGVCKLEISEETRQRLRDSHTGKTIPEETRLKMSFASKGKPKSETHAANIRKCQKGKVVSESQLALLRENARVNSKTPEALAKLSDSLKGRKAYNKNVPCSEEQKLKVSEGLKLYFKNKREQAAKDLIEKRNKV